MEPTRLKVESTIAASPDKVWSYFTDPEHIVAWNSASEEWHCPSATNDLRVGGSFSSRMEARDGSAGFDFEGTYDEVVDGEHFAYTMTDGRKATVDFADLDGQTQVTIVFDAEAENSPDYQQQGWQSILDEFQKYVEAN